MLINHDLTISGSTAGAYACRVLLTDGSTIMQNFSITGEYVNNITVRLLY